MKMFYLLKSSHDGFLKDMVYMSKFVCRLGLATRGNTHLSKDDS